MSLAAYRGSSPVGYLAAAGRKVPAQVPPPPEPKPDDADERRRMQDRMRATLHAMQWPRWHWDDADDRQAWLAYQQMTADPLVHSAVRHTVDSVASQDLQVIPDDPANKRQRRVAALCKRCVERCRGGKLHAIRSIAVPALTYGWSLTHKKWDEEQYGEFKGKWRWGVLKQKPVRSIHPICDEYLDVEAYKSDLEPTLLYNPADFIYYAHWKIFENPEGRSALRAAYRHWFMRRVAEQFWVSHLEKWGSPILVGTYALAQDKAEMVDALTNAQSTTYIAIRGAPKDAQTASVQAIGAATGGADAFEKFVDHCSKMILVGIMGSHLPILEGGQQRERGNTIVQKGVAEIVQWALAEEVAAVLTEQFVQVTQLNFPGVPPPVAVFGGVDLSEATILLGNADIAKNKLGMKISEGALMRQAGLPPAEDDEDVLGAAMAKINGGMMAPPPGPPNQPFAQNGGQNAIETGREPQGDQQQHPPRGGGGQAAKAGRGNRAQPGAQVGR